VLRGNRPEKNWNGQGRGESKRGEIFTARFFVLKIAVENRGVHVIADFGFRIDGSDAVE
jgi:hypothetical protein